MYKAYYRRGLAYERAEKYSKAKDDIQYCRQKRPLDTDVSKALNRIKEAIAYHEREEKTRSMMSPQKLQKELDKIKNQGNTVFKKKDYDAAIEHFTKAIDLYKENLDVVKLENSNELNTLAISLFTNRAL